MLTKYRLVNVPEGGVDHLIPSFGKVSVTEEKLTDDIADAMIAVGLDGYFEPVEANVPSLTISENVEKKNGITEEDNSGDINSANGTIGGAPEAGTNAGTDASGADGNGAATVGSRRTRAK